jgi:hypothetical protein
MGKGKQQSQTAKGKQPADPKSQKQTHTNKHSPLSVVSKPKVVGVRELHQKVQQISLGDHGKLAKAFLSNAGSEVASHEVMLKITKYLDFARAAGDVNNVLSLSFNMEQDLLAPDAANTLGNNAVLSRVKRCKLSAYPRSTNGQNGESTYAALTSVPVRGGGGAAELNAHQQSVVVPPNFNLHWHKLFDCDYDKLFESAQVLPVDSTNFPLFNTTIVDVDTFDPLLETIIQLKVEIWINQTVPLRSSVELGVAYQPDFVNSTSVAADTLAFVQVLGMSNTT